MLLPFRIHSVILVKTGIQEVNIIEYGFLLSQE